MKLFFFIITIVILLVSCSSNGVFEQNKVIKNGYWNQNDILNFNVEISDTNTLHNFYINIRNSTDYKFSNIYFFIETYFPDGSFFRDTVECILADIDGRWLGKGLGKIKENQILLKKNVKFPQKGLYEFKFEQAMRVENLIGVEDFGIKIEKQ
ncbi:MAG: gliding motility lipoprotein GldH [Bacteroidales bacterium]|nr:gliding motility lipoprotein GldH [Bacteroidales bacterium]